MWKRIKYHPFMIRLLHWEYWPIYIANIPVAFFWLIQAMRTGDIFFFSAVNPAIPTGGFFGEKKHEIYTLIPPEYLPKTQFYSEQEVRDGTAQKKISASGISFPVVCKPDVGERGMAVKVINTLQDFEHHVQIIPGGVIVQEYISYPLELSVMVHRLPGTDEGHVTSVCRKVFLSVTGDGDRSIDALISENPRAILQRETLAGRMDLSSIPAQGETVLLEAIGNHCRGTQFVNANHWITPQLEETMVQLLARMPGVFYGRFDLRTTSIEALTAGREFLIMEFNGASSEPAHIYDPRYGALRAYRDLWRHWQIMYRIYRIQKRHGVRAMDFKDGLEAFRIYSAYKKKSRLVTA